MSGDSHTMHLVACTRHSHWRLNRASSSKLSDYAARASCAAGTQPLRGPAGAARGLLCAGIAGRSRRTLAGGRPAGAGALCHRAPGSGARPRFLRSTDSVAVRATAHVLPELLYQLDRCATGGAAARRHRSRGHGRVEALGKTCGRDLPVELPFAGAARGLLLSDRASVDEHGARHAPFLDAVQIARAAKRFRLGAGCEVGT